MGTEIQVVSSSSSFYSKLNWKINNFSKLNAQDGSYSDVFSVGDYKWKVRIHPKGEGKVYDHLSLYLKPVDLTKTVYTEFSFAVASQSDPNNRVRHGTNHIFPERRRNKSYGWLKFMRLSELYDPTKGYIVDDTCVITIEVTCIMKEEESNVGGVAVEKRDPDEFPECKRCKIKDERQ